jgi:hypothetical protein
MAHSVRACERYCRVPDNDKIYYAGYTGGGVWKTMMGELPAEYL